MARDLKFAMCHVNTAIKKSLVFRSLDLDSSLQIVPPKEPINIFELISLDKKDSKLLKNDSFSGNYNTFHLPSNISDREIVAKLQQKKNWQIIKNNFKFFYS